LLTREAKAMSEAGFATRGDPIGSASTALVFVSDPDSEGTIRQALSDIGVANEQAEFVSGDASTATDELAQRASPRLLVVDISGIEQPESRISELARVCEPSTGVVVIGDQNDIRLYRNLKNAGVADYFFKPLVHALITQTFSGILKGRASQATAHTGRPVFVLGVRGGVGATTIAVSTAWQLAEAHKRWVMLLDLDISGGNAALQLDREPSHALTEALERPERVDELFLDRGVTHVTPRLDLLASLEPLGEEFSIAEPAVLSLLNNLLGRYRFIFVDIPAAVASRLPQVLHLPSLCIMVSDASLAAARDVARWRERIGPNTPERTTLHILNQGGAPGAIPESEFIRITGQAPEIVIPYLRAIEAAASLGVNGMKACAPLRRALAPVLRQLVGEETEPRQSLFSRLFG
jgi:pilus assembly protein CpaE